MLTQTFALIRLLLPFVQAHELARPATVILPHVKLVAAPHAQAAHVAAAAGTRSPFASSTDVVSDGQLGALGTPP